MRAALLLASPMLAIAAVPALAQGVATASQEFEMLGDAPAACVLNSPTASGTVNASFSATSASAGQISITELVDPQTAMPRQSAIQLSLPAVCNTSHRVTVRSSNGGLLRAGGQASNRQSAGRFGDFLIYSFGIDWAGQSLVRPSDAGLVEIDSTQPRDGEILLRVTTPEGGGPLVAGQYSDSIVVEVQASN